MSLRLISNERFNERLSYASSNIHYTYLALLTLSIRGRHGKKHRGGDFASEIAETLFSKVTREAKETVPKPA